MKFNCCYLYLLTESQLELEEEEEEQLAFEDMQKIC